MYIYLHLHVSPGALLGSTLSFFSPLLHISPNPRSQIEFISDWIHLQMKTDQYESNVSELPLELPSFLISNQFPNRYKIMETKPTIFN